MLAAFPSTSILDSTAPGRSLLTAASASAQRSLLGLGTLATQNGNIADYLTTASAVANFQPLDSDLTAIAALSTTTFGRSLLTQADAAAVRTLIGAGTSSFNGAYSSLTGIPATFAPSAHNQAWSTITSTPTTLSGYGITDAQPLDSDLTAIAALTTTTYGLSLLTQADAPTARTTLGLGTGDSPTFSNATATNRFFAGNGTTTVPSISFANFTGTGFSSTATSILDFAVGGNHVARLSNAGNFAVLGTGSIGFANGAADNTADTLLFRDAANILAQRNGVNAQAFRLYNTFTDSSNYERGKFAWSGNVLQIGTEKAGTGAARALELQTDGATRLGVSATLPQITIGSDANATLIFSYSGAAFTNQANGRGLAIFARSGLSANDIGLALTGDTVTATSGGANVHTLFNRQYAPTSGTGTFHLLRLVPVINQTGGANGASRGIIIAPTLTSAADYASIESLNGSVILTDTYAAGSGSLAGSLLNLGQTWNTTGTPTAILLNVTDTASNAASLLMNIRVGGANRFSVDKSGIVTASSTIVSSGGNLQSGASIYTQNSLGQIGWQPGGTWDLTLFRDAANILAQRNGVSPQALRVYNTFTDSNNYERAKIAWESNVLRIGTENLGTGSARGIEFTVNANTWLTIAANGVITSTAGIIAGSASNMNINNASFGGAVDDVVFSTSAVYAPPSGSRTIFNVTSNFSPTSGTARYSAFNIAPTINQTGGANGITRGIHINPTLTSAADFRAIEVASGKTVLAASTTGATSLNIPSGSDPTSPNNGDIWQNSNLLKVRLNGRTQTLSYQITSGTAVPTGGSDGDIYLQYT